MLYGLYISHKNFLKFHHYFFPNCSIEYQLKMLSSLKDSATLNEHSNDSTFDSDYSILIGILVPGIFLISCLLIIIAFLIIAIVRMLNRTSNRVMPSLNSKCSF